jgi:transcriptional regulator with XRE-family HTH domain
MVGNRIKDLRKKKKLSQIELAEIIDSAGDVIGRYERGNSSPSIETAIKIADALDVSLDYLAGKIDIELNHEMLFRVEQIAKRSKEEREFIYRMIDFLLEDYRKHQH